MLPTLEKPLLAISKPIVNLRNEELAGMILTTETCGFRSKIYGFALTSLLVARKTLDFLMDSLIYHRWAVCINTN